MNHAEHFYCQSRPGLTAHVRQVPDRIREKAEGHRRLRQELPMLQGKDIRIAMTEWNYWYGPHVFGELGTRYYMKDALGIAAGLHEYFRQSDMIHSAFYAQTVNVIGCIKTTKTAAEFDARPIRGFFIVANSAPAAGGNRWDATGCRGGIERTARP